MSGHGGARPGAGRPKGSGSTATALDRHKLGEMIRQEAPALIQNLLDIAMHSEDDLLRYRVSIALIDRAYGRPPLAPSEEGNTLEDLVASLKSRKTRLIE